MMITFYGMRMYSYSNESNSNYNQWSFARNRVGGKAAMSFVLLTHLMASLSTGEDQTSNTPSVLLGREIASSPVTERIVGDTFLSALIMLI